MPFSLPDIQTTSITALILLSDSWTNHLFHTPIPEVGSGTFTLSSLYLIRLFRCCTFSDLLQIALQSSHHSAVSPLCLLLYLSLSCALCASCKQEMLKYPGVYENKPIWVRICENMIGWRVIACNVWPYWISQKPPCSSCRMESPEYQCLLVCKKTLRQFVHHKFPQWNEQMVYLLFLSLRRLFERQTLARTLEDLPISFAPPEPPQDRDKYPLSKVSQHPVEKLMEMNGNGSSTFVLCVPITSWDYFGQKMIKNYIIELWTFKNKLQNSVWQ